MAYGFLVLINDSLGPDTDWNFFHFNFFFAFTTDACRYTIEVTLVTFYTFKLQALIPYIPVCALFPIIFPFIDDYR